MRQYVRAWIHEWDLTRLDPRFTPDTQLMTDALPTGGSVYREDPDLDTTEPIDPADHGGT